MSYEIDTRCIHGEGHKCEDGNNSISYPIYQTASFSHLTPGHNPNGFDYSRESNPTRAYLEETVSSLEHAADTIAFASGMAAIATVFELFQPGDHIIAGEDCVTSCPGVFVAGDCRTKPLRQLVTAAADGAVAGNAAVQYLG